MRGRICKWYGYLGWRFSRGHVSHINCWSLVYLSKKSSGTRRYAHNRGIYHPGEAKKEITGSWYEIKMSLYLSLSGDKFASVTVHLPGWPCIIFLTAILDLRPGCRGELDAWGGSTRSAVISKICSLKSRFKWIPVAPSWLMTCMVLPCAQV